MTSSGQDEPSPPPELQGLDAKDLLQAGLETVPPVTLPPQPVDADATLPVARPQSTQPAAQVELPLPEELTTLLPGGNYHVESFLGQGGMGAVYKGMQVRLKRPVAIKIMRRDMGKDYDFEARFEREAQAMAKLNHPNIVSVIDYGEAGPDYLYIVMELIDGADLMDVIRGGQMTQEMALSLLPQICDALQFAHDHGIVHRDIKPSNIMVTRDGRVKMADFGLAKPMDGIESGFRTQTGTGMGTPDYAAPEQFDPSGHIDHRADIYALGVMIYQMITGQLPRGAWKPPSQRAAVAPQWDEIVSRAMQSDPSDRYQQASEVKTDVSSIPLAEGRAAGPSAAANGPQAALGGPSALPRSNSRAALAIGTVVIGLIAFAAVFFAPREKESGTAVASSTSQQPAPAATTPNATKPTAPSKAGSEGPKSSVATATKDAPFLNTLGMKFVPVPGTQVLFSAWLTRVQDYAAFAKAQEAAGKKVDGSWKIQQKDGVPVGQEPDHPVVHVNWDDAQAFCAWLTEKDTAAGKLPQGAKYRLPTDAEWSTAVGLPPEPGTTPEEKHWKNDVDYPWGKEWPPTKRVGNYADETFHAKFPVKRNEQSNRDDNLWIEGYTDGYATTSPVGSFPANAYGLYDMGGNVWQWCEDWFNKSQTNRVLRGASWAHTGPTGPRSSSRHPRAATVRDGVHGFRCVLELGPSTAAAEPWQAPEPTVSVGTEWTNLLPHIQPPRDSIRGEWVLDQKGLHAKRAEWAICNLPVQDPGTDYDLRCQVTRGEGLHLAMFFAFLKGNTGGYVPIDYFGGGVDFADGQRWATIENITPLDIRDSASIKAKRKEWLPRGKACTVLLQVREKEVIVSVDDTEAFRWPAEWSKLQQKGGVGSPMFSEVSGGPIFGVGIFNCEAIFHRIEMRRVGNAAAAASAPIFSSATKDAPFVNTLGMKFVPVPGTPVLFSIWPTRVQDYAEFAKAQEAAGKPVSGAWKNQEKDGVAVGRELEHPVVSVNWDEAQAFCTWLTEKETAAGKLPLGAKYRLPTDAEWSTAVGLPPEQGATPEEKHNKNNVDFPWGRTWPLPPNAGNYADETFHAAFPLTRNEKDNRNENLWIKGYTDGFATTSPVGRFPANAYGLYDMGGNAWQWCEDWFNINQTARVLRGASWKFEDRSYLLSSSRGRGGPPTIRVSYNGFRCVLAPDTTHKAAASEQWEVAQEDSGKMARIADGWRVEGSLSFKNGPARDGAVRVRAPFTPELQNVRLVGRKSADGQDLYQVFINSDGARASIQRRKKGEYTGVEGLTATPLATPLKAGEPCELEARFIGPGITVKINGQTVLQGEHQALAEGSFGLYTGAGTPVTLKSIEFLNLDERPTSEPWQDMLQDLRFGVYGAVKRTPDGLHFSSKGTARLKQGTLRDMSVRLTSTFTGKIGPQVNVRVSTKGSYHLFVKDNRTLRWGRWDEAAQQTVLQKEFHLDKPLATGQEYELELRVIGQTFTSKLDGEVVGTATDGPATSGELGAGVAGPEATSIVITALEFLNLDEPGSASPSLPLSNSPSSATGDAPIINDRGR